MIGKILILGGYGNFGKRIATALSKRGVPLIIAGRSKEKAENFARSIGVEAIALDVTRDLNAALMQLKPVVVIHTCGPFQQQGYAVARSCIAQGIHYIDLADGRDFVTGISTLDTDAKKASVAVISGASTVPGLSSAVVEKYRNEFSVISSMVFGISPGQQAERGLATTQGILSYVGKPLALFAGRNKPAYGWQDIYRQEYPQIGKRWMANCDIPDLDLLPQRYNLASIRFSAGLELGFMHLGLWLLSWLVRAGLPINLPRYAETLLAISNKFNGLGSADGGMHVLLRGTGKDGKPHERRWFIIAKQGDGPQIPCVPAIVLAEKIARENVPQAGAYGCVGLVTLEEYLEALKGFAISHHTA